MVQTEVKVGVDRSRDVSERRFLSVSTKVLRGVGTHVREIGEDII